MSKEINIKTGELAVETDSAVIKTGSIGSCVIITLYDKVRKIGGLAHAMLPTRRDGTTPDPSTASFDEGNASAKYVDDAVNNLVYGLKKIGGKIEDTEAKLIGGASMFKKLTGDTHGIGYQNVEAARNKLKSLGIKIENEDTGGGLGRSVIFNLSNGLVEIVTSI